MSGQNTLVIIAEDAQVKRPSHIYNWQVYRDTAVAGSGTYKAMNMNGVVEIIGGPGAGSGIPFGNDTDPAANNVQVTIPGATLTDGYTFEVNILTTNTGAVTLQTNALGVKNVVDSDGNALVAGMLDNESIYLFVYDLQNDRYQLLGLARPSPDEIWEKGTGLESAQLINTLFPNNASGDYSVAEGQQTTASAIGTHAEGAATTASADYAHAEGEGTIASGGRSHAEGSATLASGLNSHAEGSSSSATGANSHAEGAGSSASGLRAHAEGNLCQAIGNDSHAEGGGTQAIADFAHAEGNNTIADGGAAHAQNEETTATGIGSHAEGLLTLASGSHSHAQGRQTTASGQASHAGGQNSIASGANSFSHGNANEAAAENSASLGGDGNTVDINSPRSVALGGTANNIVGEPDTAQAQNLRTTGDFRITQGANKNAGVSAALVGGTLVVAHNNVKAGAIILVSCNTPAGVQGILSAPTAGIIANTSFTINSSDAGDTSTVNYLIINP